MTIYSLGRRRTALGNLLERARKTRHDEATRRARAALARLRAAGMECGVTGSLARGDFHGASDVDLVIWCSPKRRMEALGIAADELGDFPADILFADCLDPEVRDGVMRDFKPDPP